MAASYTAPDSVLIVGSGVFGLSTALALTEREEFAKTTITVVDRHEFPAPDGASIDTSRLIRADYADPDYAHLAASAQLLWRQPPLAQHYHETGLVLTTRPSHPGPLAASLATVRALHHSADPDVDAAIDVEALPAPADIVRASGTPGAAGTHGYINRRSGWADAEGAMRQLYRRVRATGRVQFVVGTVARLTVPPSSSSSSSSSPSGPAPAEATITGATLTDGRRLPAALTILAAGAWTNALLPTAGALRATAQVMAYLPLSPAEAAALAPLPAQIDLARGLFVIPPPPGPHPDEDGAEEADGPEGMSPNPHRPRHPHLKVARHAAGYLHHATVPDPAPSAPASASVRVSLPVPHALAARLPPDADAELRRFLRELFDPADDTRPAQSDARWPPSLRELPRREWAGTRICHYLDTPDGSFMVGYAPGYGRSVFLATGGCGHAFKFLPVLGDRVVDVLCGRGGRWEEKWGWRWKGGVEEGRWLVDGIRGGGEGEWGEVMGLMPVEGEEGGHSAK